MSLNCGIVGLPNVGKSTIFSALTASSVKIENYPFCTIEPNVGIVEVPDERLHKIAGIFEIEKRIPATIEFLDIAGLVEGASQGEGLGNQFLARIREVNVIIHVVRCFENPDVSHPYDEINPLHDIEIIEMELTLKDLETVEKQIKKNKKLLKNGNKTTIQDVKNRISVLEKLKKFMEEGRPVRKIELSDREKNTIRDLNLLSSKKVLYVCNIGENDINEDSECVQNVRNYSDEQNSQVVKICGKDEAEIAMLETEEEKKEFMEMLGIKEMGLHKLIRTAYNLLDLRTFFTENGKEVRAWDFKKGMKAPQAAGIVHTDFQEGFIKAEVYNCKDLFKYESKNKLKENGKIRIEGKDYRVKDGDIIQFHFKA